MIDFKTAFELDSRNRKIVQITNLQVDGLDFFMDAILETENTFRNKVIDFNKECDTLRNKLSKYNIDNNGSPTEDDYKILEIITKNKSGIYLSKEYLTALAEMKIVYLSKSLEIKIKSLIQIAYPEMIKKNFYQWDSMKSFFESIDVDLSILIGNKETNELRQVNNCIKHSNNLCVNLKEINEFANQTELNAYNLDLFHQRIKKKIDGFFRDLSDAVINNLYTYDDQRIENICNSFAEKMDKNTLQKLIEKLKIKTHK